MYYVQTKMDAMRVNDCKQTKHKTVRVLFDPPSEQEPSECGQTHKPES